MSAPNTNIEKEKRRHKTALVGVGLAVAFGFVMFLLYTFNAFEGAPGPDGTAQGTEAETSLTVEGEANGQAGASDDGDVAD